MKKLQKDKRTADEEKIRRARDIQRQSEEAVGRIGKNRPNVERKPIKDCEVGDEVYVFDLSRNGKVFSVDKKKKTAVVVAGNFKSSVRFERLGKPQKSETEAKKPRTRHNVTSKADREIRTELMLLGKNVDEACMLTDNFIDGAVLSGLRILYLVHGKGTGALRKGLHEHLRTHRSVKSFRVGLYGEGEDGVTVVELK